MNNNKIMSIIKLMLVVVFMNIITVNSFAITGNMYLKIDGNNINNGGSANIYNDSIINITGSISGYSIDRIVYNWDNYEDLVITSNNGNIAIPNYIVKNATHVLNIKFLTNTGVYTDSVTYNLYYSSEENTTKPISVAKINDTNIYDNGYYTMLSTNFVKVKGIYGNTNSTRIQYKWNNNSYSSYYINDVNISTSGANPNAYNILSVRVYDYALSMSKVYNYNIYVNTVNISEVPVLSTFIDGNIMSESVRNDVNEASKIKIVGTHNSGISKIEYRWNTETAYTTVNYNPYENNIPTNLVKNSSNTLYVRVYSNDSTPVISKIYQYTIYVRDTVKYLEPNLTVKLNNVDISANNTYTAKYNDDIYISATHDSGIKSIVYNWDGLNNTEIATNSVSIKVPNTLTKNTWHNLNVKANVKASNSLTKELTFKIYVTEAASTSNSLNIRLNGSNINNLLNNTITIDSGSILSAASTSSTALKEVRYSWNGSSELSVSDSSKILIPSTLQYNAYHTLKIYGINNDNSKTQTYTVYIYYGVKQYELPEVKVYINNNSINSNSMLPYTVRSGDKITVLGIHELGIKKIEYRWNNETSKTVTGKNIEIDKPTTVLTNNTLYVKVYSNAINNNETGWYGYSINYANYTSEGLSGYLFPFKTMYGEQYNNKVSSTTISLKNINNSKLTSNTFLLGEEAEYSIDIVNKFEYLSGDLNVTFTIPSGVNVTFTNASQGEISGNTVTWKLSNLAYDTKISIPVKVKFNSMSGNYVKLYPNAKVKLDNYIVDSSTVITNLYLNSSTTITTKHEPYILGDSGTNTFRPNDSLTRAEFATIMTRVFNLSTTNLNNNFKDSAKIKQNYAWAEKNILACYNNGLIFGYEDGEFKPENKVTKAEMLVMISRKLSKDTSLINITKEPIKLFDTSYGSTTKDNSWNYKAVSELFRINALSMENLTTNQTLDKTITRAEFANIMNRVLNRLPANNAESYAKFSDINKYSTKFYEDIVEASTASHNYIILENGKENIVK